MSHRNALRKWRDGIVSDYDDACTPAAFDSILPNVQISDETYRYFVILYRHWTKSSEMQRRGHLFHGISLLAKDIGDLSLRDLEFVRVPQRIESLQRIVNRAIDKDKLIVVDTLHPSGNFHALGLVPVTEELFKMTGVPIQKSLSGLITLEKLVDHLYIPPHERDQQFPFLHANITLVPNL